MKNKFFNKRVPPPGFDFNQMGIDQAQKLLSVAMKGNSDQLANQYVMVKSCAIELLASLAFNFHTEDGETDRQAVFALVKEYSDEIVERALNFKADEMEFVPAEKH
jgi:hypothetical protein